MLYKSIAALVCVLVCVSLVSALDITTPLTTRIYVGGSFSTLNGTTFNNIAYYDLKAKSFIPLSNGTNGVVKVVHVDAMGNVYIGGDFTMVGGVVTGPLAMWSIITTSWTAPLTKFSAGSVVTSIDTNCATLVSSVALPCDIFVGGTFSVSTPFATNLVYYDAISKAWNAFQGLTASSVTAIQKNEFQTTTYNKVYLGGVLTTTGENPTSYSFGVYDTSKNTFTGVVGVGDVRDIYYNPNLLSTDNIFIAATSFSGAAAACKNICSYNHKTGVFSATVAGSINTQVNLIRYTKGISSSSVGNIYVGGPASTGVKIFSGTGDYAAVGGGQTDSPTSDYIYGMDVCGTLSNEKVTACAAGSVAVGGNNFFKFYDASTSQWTNILKNELSNFQINSVFVKTSSAITSTISMVVMIAVACILALF